MDFYVVPKADQYDVCDSTYFKLLLPIEDEELKRPAPAPQHFVLRDLQLSARNLKVQRVGDLRSIAKNILNSDGKMKKQELIELILQRIRLEE